MNRFDLGEDCSSSQVGKLFQVSLQLLSLQIRLSVDGKVEGRLDTFGGSKESKKQSDKVRHSFWVFTYLEIYNFKEKHADTWLVLWIIIKFVLFVVSELLKIFLKGSYSEFILIGQNCFRILQKFEQEMQGERWNDAKTCCCQFLNLLNEWKLSIGYPHKAFEAGSHALACVLWKLHGNSLNLEEEKEGENSSDSED